MLNWVVTALGVSLPVMHLIIGVVLCMFPLMYAWIGVKDGVRNLFGINRRG